MIEIICENPIVIGECAVSWIGTAPNAEPFANDLGRDVINKEDQWHGSLNSANHGEVYWNILDCDVTAPEDKAFANIPPFFKLD